MGIPVIVYYGPDGFKYRCTISSLVSCLKKYIYPLDTIGHIQNCVISLMVSLLKVLFSLTCYFPFRSCFSSEPLCKLANSEKIGQHAFVS